MKRIVLFISVGLLCGAIPAYSYTGYRLFTINHTLTGVADSTNFTVLLSGTFAEFATTANGGKIQNTVACGVNSITCPADLVFASDAGCANPLGGWEFESYTATTGQMIAWVIVPTLSVTTDTLIYACSGSAAITTFQGGVQGSAFDSNTKLVYHFPDGTTLGTKDSTSGGCNATPANTPTAVAGEAGGGIHLNGVNQDVECSSFAWTGSSAVTVSFWYYTAYTSGVQNVFTVGSVGSQPFLLQLFPSTFYWKYGATVGVGEVAAGYVSYLGAWTHVELVSTGSANTYQAIYLNGSVSQSKNSSAATAVTGDLIVGAEPGGSFVNGSIDEFRISNVVRSASWIKAEYNNQSSPAVFASASSFVPRIFQRSRITFGR